MKKEDNILEQFDNIGIIEPSAEWNNTLWQKLNNAKHTSSGISASGLLMVALAVLLILNIFTYSRNIVVASRLESSNNLKNIASEFLISTNSSKY